MKSRRILALCLLLFAVPCFAQYKTALPGYHYEFPHDHFNHEDFQTEWWYYTGNLTTEDGRRFGYELTFFREGVSRDPAQKNAWDVQDIYLAHLALSDLDGGRFYHTERTNRSGPGIAGISESRRRIWNGNWRIVWNGDVQELQAIDEPFTLSFSLRSDKPPVIHGRNGVSQKAEGEGRASHYISFTRLKTQGTLSLHGKQMHVNGQSWMDHEFFSHQLEANQTGWDWLSLQLDDNTELMLFEIRRKDGSIDPFSSGTFVDATGKAHHLSREEFTLVPLGDTWTSPITSARYPVAWNISIPSLRVELRAETPLKSQELSGKSKIAPSYWEGAIKLTGRKGEASLSGVGYLEMTGYEHPVRMEP